MKRNRQGRANRIRQRIAAIDAELKRLLPNGGRSTYGLTEASRRRVVWLYDRRDMWEERLAEASR